MQKELDEVLQDIGNILVVSGMSGGKTRTWNLSEPDWLEGWGYYEDIAMLNDPEEVLP